MYRASRHRDSVLLVPWFHCCLILSSVIFRIGIAGHVGALRDYRGRGVLCVSRFRVYLRVRACTFGSREFMASFIRRLIASNSLSLRGINHNKTREWLAKTLPPGFTRGTHKQKKNPCMPVVGQQNHSCLLLSISLSLIDAPLFFSTLLPFRSQLNTLWPFLERSLAVAENPWDVIDFQHSKTANHRHQHMVQPVSSC